LFASQAWNQVKARLQFLVEHHGAGLLTGEVGAGKSTAARTFTAGLNPNLYKILYLHWTSGSALDLLRQIALELGLEPARSTPLANEGLEAGRLVYVCTDPVVHEIRFANGDEDVRTLVEEHDERRYVRREHRLPELSTACLAAAPCAYPKPIWWMKYVSLVGRRSNSIDPQRRRKVFLSRCSSNAPA
jgi:hypothetical protein